MVSGCKQHIVYEVYLCSILFLTILDGSIVHLQSPVGRDGVRVLSLYEGAVMPRTACLHADTANTRCDWRRAPQSRLFLTDPVILFVFSSHGIGEDGPTIVNINLFLRSISKIDDYKMVSLRFASHVEYWMNVYKYILYYYCTYYLYP